jgi:hypothetical protein
MRYITASLGFIICVASLSAFADETYQRNTGVSFGSGFGSTALSIRKSLSETTLVYAGIISAYSHDNSTFSGNTSKGIFNSNGLTLGTRHFLSVEKLSKFIDVGLSTIYSESRDSFGNNNYSANASLYAAYGIEYFFTTNLSIEGKAGVGFGYNKSSSASSKSISKGISLPIAATAITYYW